LFGKLKDRCSYGKKNYIFEDNIKPDRIEICYKAWDLIYLFSELDKWQAVVSTVNLAACIKWGKSQYN
jgi:hypothetical protein